LLRWLREDCSPIAKQEESRAVGGAEDADELMAALRGGSCGHFGGKPMSASFGVQNLRHMVTAILG
jgi:hypothetical protein